MKLLKEYAPVVESDIHPLELEYGYMTVNELRGCYQASCDEVRGEILEVLIDRFEYDRDYYRIAGNVKEHALWFVNQPA